MSGKTPTKSKSKKVDAVVISPKVITPKRRITSPPSKSIDPVMAPTNSIIPMSPISVTKSQSSIPKVDITPESSKLISSPDPVCLFPQTVDPQNIKIIDSYPIKVGPDVKLLHFINDEDFNLIKHKVIGYTQIDIPQHIKYKLDNGYQVVSRKTGTVMKKICEPWTILYTKKGKHYIYTSDNGLAE